MKSAEYKLAGDIPLALRGKAGKDKDGNAIVIPFTVRTREAETLTEMSTLVENGDDKHVLRLAQGQYDIIVQRKIREYLASDEVENILAGKTVGDEDFAAHTDEERVAEVLTRAQEVADAYQYGSRTSVAGGGQKAAVERDKKVRAAASADPELAAKLAALGITL